MEGKLEDATGDVDASPPPPGLFVDAKLSKEEWLPERKRRHGRSTSYCSQET